MRATGRSAMERVAGCRNGDERGALVHCRRHVIDQPHQTAHVEVWRVEGGTQPHDHQPSGRHDDDALPVHARGEVSIARHAGDDMAAVRFGTGIGPEAGAVDAVERLLADVGAPSFGQDATGRRAKLTQTRTPILVISGDRDTSTAGQNWFPLIGQMRNAQFVFYPESGHGPQHQYPELSAQYITDFIARTTK